MRVRPLRLGTFPTPVYRLDGLDLPRGELFVKDDGRSSPLYGGNKVRKLEWLLARALARGARRILTVGAAGSHHVLATTIFAREAGLLTAAVLGEQPWTPHAEQNLSCAIRWGLEARPAPSWVSIPAVLVEMLSPGDYVVLPGGSSPLGARGYRGAAQELVRQIAAGELPEPDIIVTALGTGGTVAGLLAGVREAGLRARVLGVSVAVSSPTSLRALTLGLARAIAPPSASLRDLNGQLELDMSELGAGYGFSTPSADAALALGTRAGLSLDTTYTSKAFAAALRLLGCPDLPSTACRPPAELSSKRPLRVLYWHTLSSVPHVDIARNAPLARDVPRDIRCLLRTG